MSVIYRLEELNPDAMAARLAAMPVLLLPMGTIEWHSYHLPFGLDGLKAQTLAAAVAVRSGAVLAPTAWWAAGGVPYPYTLRLPASLLEPLLQEVFIQYARMGFRTILLMNGHYGLENSIAVRRAALRCMQATSATVLPVAEYELLTDQGNLGDHAGTWETSLLWAARPDLIHLDAVSAGAELPGVSGQDPRGNASRELGLRAVETVADRAVASILRSLAEGAVERERYIGALEAGLRSLEALAVLRSQKPRSTVPPVATPVWVRHLESLNAGQYAEAASWAERKLVNPAE